MILFINEVLAFFVGLFFNTALLYLIHRRTPSLMRSYALILKIHAVSDLLFDITNFVTSTVSFFYKSLINYSKSGDLVLPINKRTVLLCKRRNSFVLLDSKNGIPVRGNLLVDCCLRSPGIGTFRLLLSFTCSLPVSFFSTRRTSIINLFSGDLISKRQIGLLVAAAYTLSFIVAFPINGLYMIAGPSPATQDFDSNLQQALNVSREHLSGYLTMGLVSYFI